MSRDVLDLEKFRRGERVQNDHTLTIFKCKPTECEQHIWRTVVCVSERDICECSICGEQREFACNFDEDMS